MEKNNEKTIDMIKFEVPYFQAPNGIFDLKLDIKANSKLVYLYLCRCGNRGADAFPSYNMIAEVCGIGKRTAIDCVQELVDVNLLYKESRKNEKGEATSNLYIVNTPDKATCTRLTKELIKAKKKTRKKGSATDSPLKNESLGSATDALGGATDALGGATDALGGATDALYKELLDKELLDKEPYINNYVISSSSKGKTPDSSLTLPELFNYSICKLKKTTTVKFMKYVEKYDREFIEAVIHYCEARNGRSFDYFDKAIKGFIEQGATTPELMEEAIENFKLKNKTKKNNALKAKDEKKQEEAFEESINERIMEDLAGGIDAEAIEKVEVAGEDIGEKLKNIIATQMSEVSFKVWFKDATMVLEDNTVVIGCPNGFTRDTINNKYNNIVLKAMSLTGIGKKLKVVVMAD